MICNSIPAGETWAAFQAGHNGAGDAVIGVDRDSAAKVPGVEAQRTFMDCFSAWGLQNLEKIITNKGFREQLIKGVVEDDLPYLLGEKSGMLKLFNYLLPHGISTPSHQTVQCDLSVLYDNLDDRLNQQLKVDIISILR